MVVMVLINAHHQMDVVDWVDDLVLMVYITHSGRSCTCRYPETDK